MKIYSKHKIVGLVAAAITVVVTYLELSIAEKSATCLSTYEQSINVRSAARRTPNASERAWKEYAKRNSAEFSKQLEAFQNDGFFSPEMEATFAELAKPNTPTFVQRGFDVVK